MRRSCLTKSVSPLAAAQSIGVAYHHWCPVLSHLRGRYDELGIFETEKIKVSKIWEV